MTNMLTRPSRPGSSSDEPAHNAPSQNPPSPDEPAPVEPAPDERSSLVQSPDEAPRDQLARHEVGRDEPARQTSPREAAPDEPVRRRPARRTLQAGDLVEVRPAAEILATLDADGKLDGMPFMPEMLRFAGQRFRVYKRADKTCDTTHSTGLRRLRSTVHLADLRCDGSAHGGCQAGCLLYWNERWLRRPASQAGPAGAVGAEPRRSTDPAGGLPEARLADLARRPAAEDGSDRWMCQATEVFSASRPLPWWAPDQYLRDLRTRNATMRQVLVGIARWLSVRVQWRINRSGVPFVKGRLATTPTVRLDLQPGERVRIKSRKEIEATLDTSNRNRGLRVDADMMLFCNQERRVLRRVSRIIDERSGALITIPGDCIVLDGVTCTGAYNRACPRSDYPYWREIWLSRVDPAAPQPGPPGADTAVGVGVAADAEALASAGAGEATPPG